VTHTDLVTVLALAIESKLIDAKQSLGLADVLFGEQEMIPLSPTVVIMPGRKQRILVGGQQNPTNPISGGRTQNELIVYLDVHSMKVGDERTERLAIDQIAENIERELHKDTSMGGIIIHGFVTEWDPGVTSKQNGEFRTVRMTFVGQTRTMLGS